MTFARALMLMLLFTGNAFAQSNLIQTGDLATRGLVPAGTPESREESYKIKIGYNPIEGTRIVPDVQRDWWKLLAVAALGTLVVEWYIYNRRVYV